MARARCLYVWSCIWFLTAGSLATQTQASELHGMVVASVSRRPLPGADVILLKRNFSILGNILRGGMDAPPTVIGKVRTDAKGRFSFTPGVTGPFEISVYDGRTRSSGVVQVVRSGSDFITIATFKLPARPSLFPPP